MFLWIQSILSTAQVSVPWWLSVTIILVLHITNVPLLVSCHRYLNSLWNFPFFKGKNFSDHPSNILFVRLLFFFWLHVSISLYWNVKLSSTFTVNHLLASPLFQVVWLFTVLVVWETSSRYLVKNTGEKSSVSFRKPSQCSQGWMQCFQLRLIRYLLHEEMGMLGSSKSCTFGVESI